MTKPEQKHPGVATYDEIVAAFLAVHTDDETTETSVDLNSRFDLTETD